MGLLFLVFCVALFFAAKNKSVNVDGVGHSTRGMALAVAGILTLVLAIMTYFTCVYSQDPGEAKVQRSFTGEVIGSDISEGLGFKLPWVSNITYDIRNQVVDYGGDGSGKGKTGPAIPAQDKDGATATIDVVVRYSLDPSSVESTYKQYGSQSNFESKLILNDVRSVVRNIPLKYSTATFRLNREKAALEMQSALADRWDGEGIFVETVELRDIRYPESIENSLQAVQEATNNANKAKADLETARVNAEQTRVEAQAQADYDQIVRCGAKTEIVKEVINGTETNVTKVIPLNGAACQNRLNDQVLINKYIDALKEMAAQGNLVVIPEGFGGILNLPGASKQ